VFDAQMGYEPARNLQLRLDVFNLFNAETDDISYYYESRLPGEPPEGVADRHVHPGHPRSLRASQTPVGARCSRRNSVHALQGERQRRDDRIRIGASVAAVSAAVVRARL